MGLLVKGDFETNFGKISELYLRVESIYFNRPSGKLNFSITHWLDKQYADEYTKLYADDEDKKNRNNIDERILIFKKDGSVKEFLFKHSYEVFLATEKEIEVPIYDMVVKEVEIPYISFDENGDEIQKVRIEEQETKTQVGTEKVTKQVIDLYLLENVLQFCYNTIKQDLVSTFGEKNLIDN